MLNCCYDLEIVKKTGITLTMFTGLATCQGMVTKRIFADQAIEEQFRETVEATCVERDEDDEFDQVLCVSYHRKVLGQTGSGHFSPIAAFDRSSDSVLVLDTARFKYGAHWVPLPLLFAAMQPIDPDTGRSRGYVTLKKHDSESGAANFPMPLMLRSEMKQRDARKAFKHYLQSLEKTKEVSYDDVVRFCETNETIGSVWRLVKPQVRPMGEGVAMLQEVRDLLSDLLPESVQSSKSNSCGDGEENGCRPAQCRTIQLAPEEAMYVMYLASLDPVRRNELVTETMAPERAKKQLLAEAELVWYTIDASDDEIERVGS